MERCQEITIRGILLGVFITIIFTTANVYLGLKAGLTFASSIPAAVFAMAFFKLLGNNNILENNIVQTQVSAAGTLSAIVFIIPALFFVGYWNHFHFWQTFAICACGGILGVIFTIPFRIELVEKNKLPYPEGVAAAEVLQLGEKDGDSGAKEMLCGATLSSLSIFLAQGLKVTSDGFGIFLQAGKAVFQIPMGFSLALIGAGWLVGISVGIAILVGVFLTWGILVPLLSSEALHAGQELATIANQIWAKDVRFIGVGLIGVSAIWTFLTILKPTIRGLKNSLHFSSRSDIPAKYLVVCFICVSLLIIATFHHFISQASFSHSALWTFVIIMSLASIFVGFLVSATCGYMAGLVGSSSSPISGIGIIGVVFLSLCVLFLTHLLNLPMQDKQFFIALSLFATSVVFAVATIANDNLQDLKTGAIVKATPWKQEVVLMIGCIVGASVVAPVLNLLYDAYGFIDHLPREGMSNANALSAPQAILMATIADGIFKNTLNWHYINLGIMLGIFFIFLNFLLSKKSISLPPLAIGMGVYLPPIITIPIFTGALLAYIASKKVSNNAQDQESFKKRGTLLASGLIVGESLMGILLAGYIVANLGTDAPILPFSVPTIYQEIAGSVFFVFALIYLYARSTRKSNERA
ncbi:OPT family oligopeptide transporter [Helicobacter enhydrae]|nr:oligopeptide transporter, OPT family [Helicobacter enhydrae]